MKIRHVFGHFVIALLFSFSSLRGWAQTELIVNGGFESGDSGWVMSGGTGAYTDYGYARSGLGYLWLGGVTSEIDEGYQTVTIPANATSATLSYYYNIFSLEDTSAPYDTFQATIKNNSGSVLATISNKSNIDQDPGPGNPDYHQQTFNLLPYAGQTIRISFASQNDDSFETSFLIDDVSVQVNAVVLPPANDACSGAISIVAGSTYTADTSSATSTGDPTPSCEPTMGKGVWYAYTPTATGTATISTCGSSFDTVLAIFSGTCGSLTPVACNNDNGTACSGSQASVSFAGTAGTTYFILAGGVGGASGSLTILATGPTGLRIIPTFASSIANDPQAGNIEATINAAIAVYQNNFSNSITIAITFQEMGSGLGLSSTYYSSYSYASYRSALLSHSTTADDAIALAHIPNTPNNPVNGNSSLNITLPLARALGFSANPPPGQPDGTISLNTSSMNLSLSTTNPSKYSLFATVCHEIDEVLGLGSALNGLSNGDPAPTGPISPEDLFRYDSTGTRNFTTDVNAASYFSLDGVTDLARFNQHQGGDFQDWYSFSGGQIPQVQDAYSPPGVSPVPNVELRVLDVLGYARVIPPLPTLSLARASGFVVLSWPTTFTGFTLQSATNGLSAPIWTAVTNAPSIVNGFYTVTNSVSGSAKFYRLTK